MEKFTFINAKGQSVVIGNTEDLQLTGATGLTATEIVPYTIQGYRQNGYTLTNVQLGARIISLDFALFGVTDADFYKKRLQLIGIFNPLLGEGTLVYENDVVTRAITVQVTQNMDVKTNHASNLKEYTIEFTAYNPLWRDARESALSLEDAVGGLTFPFKFNDSIAFTTTNDTSAIITVTGDVPSPLRVEFIGGAYQPRIELSNTREFIDVNIRIAKGEKLVITTDYGNKLVNKYNLDGTISSANTLITTDSTFFSLPVGENRVAFSSTAGDGVKVYIYWYNWYLGV